MELSRQTANFGSTSIPAFTGVRAGEPPIIAVVVTNIWRLLGVGKSIASIHLVGQAKPTAEEEAVLGHPDEVARNMRITESGALLTVCTAQL